MALAVAIGAPAFSTTCPFHRYVVTGRVTVPQDVKVVHVRVYVFLEGSDTTSAYQPEQGEHEYASPSSDGTFRFVSYYSTWNTGAVFPWQTCNRRARHADVVFVADGLASKRVRVPTRQSGRSAGGLPEFVAESPLVAMEATRTAPSESSP